MAKHTKDELKELCKSPSSLQLGFHEVFTNRGPISEYVYLAAEKRLVVTAIHSAMRASEYRAFEIPPEIDTVEKLFSIPGFFGPAIPHVSELRPDLYERIRIALNPGLFCEDSKHKFIPVDEVTGFQSFKCCYCGKSFSWGLNPGYWLQYRGSTVDGECIHWPGTKFLCRMVDKFSLSYGNYLTRYVSLEGSTLKVENRTLDGDYDLKKSLSIPLDMKQKKELIDFVRGMPLHEWETSDATLHAMYYGSTPGRSISGVFCCNAGPRFVCYDAWRYGEFAELCQRLEAIIAEHVKNTEAYKPAVTTKPTGANAKLIKCRCGAGSRPDEGEVFIPLDYKHCPRCGEKLDDSTPAYANISFITEDKVWVCSCGAIMPQSHAHCGYCGGKRP